MGAIHVGNSVELGLHGRGLRNHLCPEIPRCLESGRAAPHHRRPALRPHRTLGLCQPRINDPPLPLPKSSCQVYQRRNQEIYQPQRSADRQIGDMLYSISAVKLHVLEVPLLQKIAVVRASQLKALRKYLIPAFCYFTSVNQSIPSFMALTAFATHSLLGNEFSNSTVCPALTLFNMICAPAFKLTLVEPRSERAAVAGRDLCVYDCAGSLAEGCRSDGRKPAGCRCC
ncbi:uncharacterized protein EV422DRAFT_261368 [Fimicolochytrium jonesii]|uniref:uncharacterized protein n=1 Tax=Fimicolochytrium jonesii TaxID=1396493 RepID=UPI0022FE54C5|nr:uncharacterized protein EV422DRAFT_261368 [Fimicolochytrium jonesii]KAI8817025.1 hypothetical protein EV422DRAFT_261368 [Fimicolochytrium jonesii]